jgi:hypothetical protein
VVAVILDDDAATLPEESDPTPTVHPRLEDVGRPLHFLRPQAGMAVVLSQLSEALKNGALHLDRLLGKRLPQTLGEPKWRQWWLCSSHRATSFGSLLSKSTNSPASSSASEASTSSVHSRDQ